jgi:hypothetical protein
MPHPHSFEGKDFPFQRYLQDEPELSYFSAIPGGLRGGQRRFAQSQFQEMLNQFTGKLGQQAREGVARPTLQYQDFFTPERIRQQLFSFSPSQRGFGTARFAPPVEFQF